MKTLLRLLLKNHHQQNRSKSVQTEKGMTLVELLVGVIMAFLIITPMLGFVVDMLNTDRREQVKTNTEQDVQAALDFIAQDLSQAIYIYDNAGITAINQSPTPLPSAPNETPILVFWKRKQIKNAVDPNQAAPRTPLACDLATPPNGPNLCDDTYVRSLVAYYLVAQNTPNNTWCQPSGNECPSRIARYEISEGVKDSRIPPVNANGYFSNAEVKVSQRHSPAFNSAFDWSTQPTDNVTTPVGLAGLGSEVLVNYIDHSPLVPPPPGDECQQALGNPRAPVPGTTGTAPVPETTLRIPPAPPDTVNSFYACVDTARNLARVTIRGNSLRRLQPDNANYDPDRSAYFPKASVQVQGLGARGN